MLIIEINSADGKFHHFQSQSHRTECWLDGYIEVPEELEATVFESCGYCELTIENNVLVDVIPHPEWRPVEPANSSAQTGEQVTWDALAAAYAEGVNEA